MIDYEFTNKKNNENVLIRSFYMKDFIPTFKYWKLFTMVKRKDRWANAEFLMVIPTTWSTYFLCSVCTGTVAGDLNPNFSRCTASNVYSRSNELNICWSAKNSTEDYWYIDVLVKHIYSELSIYSTVSILGWATDGGVGLDFTNDVADNIGAKVFLKDIGSLTDYTDEDIDKMVTLT